MLLSYCAYLYNGLRKYFHTSSGTVDHSKNGVQGFVLDCWKIIVITKLLIDMYPTF